MTDNIDLKQDKKLNKLFSVLMDSPFGSTMSQIMNDCRVSNKTAKQLLEVADFVKKDGDLYFIKDHVRKSHEEANKKPAPVAEKPLADKPKLFSELTLSEMISLDDTTKNLSGLERLIRVLLSNPKHVPLTLSDLIANFREKEEVPIKYFISNIMIEAEKIVDQKQTLMHNRGLALKKLLQLSVLSYVANEIDITKTNLVNIALESLCGDEVSLTVSDWDFGTHTQYNEVYADFLGLVQYYMRPYLQLAQAQNVIKKPLFDASIEHINAIDDVDSRTVAILCSHWEYTADEIMLKTSKDVDRLTDDAKQIISSAYISVEYRLNAIFKYLELKASKFGMPFGMNGIKISMQDKLNADNALFAKIKEIQNVFKNGYNESGTLRNNPFVSEIYKAFQTQINNFDDFVKDLAELYQAKAKAIESEIKPAPKAKPTPEVKQPVQDKVMTTQANTAPIVNQSSLKDKFSQGLKEKHVKSLHLSLEEVEAVLKELFDMDEIKIKRNGNIITGFDLKAERDC